MEKKSRYTEAQKRSAQKYLSEAVDNITFRVPKGKKEIYKSYAARHGESFNGFIVRAMDETMERDGIAESGAGAGADNTGVVYIFGADAGAGEGGS